MNQNQNANRNSNQQKGGPMQDYVTVAERIDRFYERYPDGRIVTQILEHDSERGFIVMQAAVFRQPDDAQPSATGHAYEYKDAGYVQKTSYIEVCETSAVGRALALCGFEVKRGIASREEMEKHSRQQQSPPQQKPPQSAPPQSHPPQESEEVAAQRQELTTMVTGLYADLREAGHSIFSIKDETKEKLARKAAIKGYIRKVATALNFRNPDKIEGIADMSIAELQKYVEHLAQEREVLLNRKSKSATSDERSI